MHQEGKKMYDRNGESKAMAHLQTDLFIGKSRPVFSVLRQGIMRVLSTFTVIWWKKQIIWQGNE